MQGKWAQRAQEADQSIPFEGTRTRDMMALGATTPFIAALFEDDRLAGMGEQIFGRLIPAIAHRYVGASEWRYDAGGYDA